ncbi:hypothetical protein Ancab_025552 [Ancistrocladus abbreviatus]
MAALRVWVCLALVVFALSTAEARPLHSASVTNNDALLEQAREILKARVERKDVMGGSFTPDRNSRHKYAVRCAFEVLASLTRLVAGKPSPAVAMVELGFPISQPGDMVPSRNLSDLEGDIHRLQLVILAEGLEKSSVAFVFHRYISLQYAWLPGFGGKKLIELIPMPITEILTEAETETKGEMNPWVPWLAAFEATYSRQQIIWSPWK